MQQIQCLIRTDDEIISRRTEDNATCCTAWKRRFLSGGLEETEKIRPRAGMLPLDHGVFVTPVLIQIYEESVQAPPYRILPVTGTV